MVLPMAVIWIALSVHLLDDTFHLRSLMNYRVMGPYGISLLAVPLLVLWTVYGIRILLGRLGLPGGLPAGQEEGEDNR